MPQRNSLFQNPLAPLPGTDQAKRGLFIDRFGTLLESPTGKPKSTYRNMQFIGGALDALFRCTQAGWQVYLIGNESAVAQGHCKDATWTRFEDKMLAEMQQAGITVTRCYACLEDPVNGKGSHLTDSVFLLPNTGAMYHARQHDGVVLDESWVIGDSSLELAAGWRAGCRVAAVQTGLGNQDSALETEVVFSGATLVDVLDEILQISEAAQS
ncbi:MAG: D-glycero-D-manno-heptose 1,7-bisphosphate phosphatase [Candidatus Paceibacteria bacterium]|jgi:D-glycero-D-manno-heptose 1,7-bisphosphate phosphatase